tara:strand:+ start:68 stop:844 length:777 start_codon:yes stop_codon:yes gene_type:complete
MRLDKYIRDNFIHSSGTNLIKSLYLFYHRYLKKNSKKSYSGGGIDLLVNYFFRNQKSGIYLDIGCYHPIQGSNTYLLHKKGWSGINIDLDEVSIDLFDRFRKFDYNKQIAISDYEGTIVLYRPHKRAAGQTVNPQTASRLNKDNGEVLEIKCDTINNIISKSQFKDSEIDFISIDIEGHEVNALKNLDFKKFKPKIIVAEFNDPELKKVEFYHQNIENVLSSDLYQLLISKGYRFINWHHADLVFVSSDIYNKRELYK